MITGNTARSCGGIYMYNSGGSITGNTITGNTATDANIGGGICVYNALPAINDNDLYGNLTGNPATTPNDLYNGNSSKERGRERREQLLGHDRCGLDRRASLAFH